MSEIELSIVVLVLNEEEVIGSVIEQTMEAAESLSVPFEIIVTDGGSTDSTASIVQRMAEADDRIRYVGVAGSRCYGDSVREGMRRCRGRLICLIDGDGQLEPSDIIRMVEEVRLGADVVQGWRVDRKDPFLRLIVSKGYNLCLRLFLGIGLHDCNCTLKVFKREVTGEKLFESRVSMISPVIVGMALRRGMRVKELPISHRERKGASRIFGGAKIIKQIIRIFVELFEQRRFLASV